MGKESREIAKQSYYDGIQHVVHISTNIERGCAHCSEGIGGEKIAESVNHYISQHSYKLLHLGTETIHDDSGNLWHTTVAILGK